MGPAGKKTIALRACRFGPRARARSQGNVPFRAAGSGRAVSGREHGSEKQKFPRGGQKTAEHRVKWAERVGPAGKKLSRRERAVSICAQERKAELACRFGPRAAGVPFRASFGPAVQRVSVRNSLAIARQQPGTLLWAVAKFHVLFGTDGEPSLRHCQVIFQFPAVDGDIEPFARRRAWQVSLGSQPSLELKRQEDAVAMTPLTKVVLDDARAVSGRVFVSARAALGRALAHAPRRAACSRGLLRR